MLSQLYARISEKQVNAFEQLDSNINALKQQEGGVEENDNKISKQTERKDIYSQRDKNNESATKNRSMNQSQIYSRGTPIHGFKYKSEDNQQQFEQKLPCPKRLKETDNISEKNIIDLKKQTINASKANQYSIMTNKEEESPEYCQQIGQLRHVCDACSEKPNKRSSKSQNKNHLNKVECLRPKNHRNYLPKVKNSVKTQNLLTPDQEQKSKETSYMSKQFSMKKEKKKNLNIQINSNVVSYCQSLKQSSVEAMGKINASFQQNRSGLGQLKKPGHIRLKNIRYKTQEKTQKIKKQIQNEQEQFREKQKQIKLQLRVFYEKKKKIQEKLKKLNNEMAQINNPELYGSESCNLKHSYLTQKRMQRQLFAGQIIRIGQLRASNIKQQKHQSQLQKSRKAIEFVQKMSKQSLRRRIEHQKKIKKDIYNRVKQHACIDCSRVRCHVEVMEGQTKKESEVISINKSRVK